MKKKISIALLSLIVAYGCTSSSNDNQVLLTDIGEAESVQSVFAKSNLPEPLSNNVQVGIDRVESSPESQEIAIFGWAFAGGLASENAIVSVLLINDEVVHAFQTVSSERADVGGIHGMDYKNSGFATRFAKNTLPAGEYKVGILVESKDSSKRETAITDQKVTL